MKNTFWKYIKRISKGLFVGCIVVLLFSNTVDAEESDYGWLWSSEGWYFYNEQGVKAYGWVYDAGNWYFLNGDNAQYPGLMVCGCKWMIDGTEYYFDRSGAMRTGWVYDEGWYYYYGNGYKAYGWVYDNGHWYYLEPENHGKMFDAGWRLIDGAWYFLYADGQMAENCWLNLGGNWYYFDGSGAMLSGWQYIKDFWYYMYQSEDVRGGPYGAMAADTVIDGYYVDASGKWTPPHLDQMNSLAQEYISSTDYLILVDTSANKVGIYTGSYHNWSNIIYWDCSCGAPESPTVTGVFTVGIRGYYFDSGDDRCFWYTQFCGDYLFHSITYNKDGSIRDPRLGVSVSHGCVRLDITNAKWIYDTIPDNTTVVVY